MTEIADSVTADDNPFRHQDNAGPLGIFRDGRLVASIPAEHQSTATAYAYRDQFAAERGVDPATHEVLQACRVHPESSAVDCTICWPIDPNITIEES